MEACSICGTNSITENGYLLYFKCPICGAYEIDRVTKAYLNSLLDTEEKKILLISAIRRMQGKNRVPLLINMELVRSFTTIPFPSPQIQMKNFILWLGDNTNSFGRTIQANILKIRFEIVSLNTDSTKLIIKHLEKGGLITVIPSAGAWEDETYTLGFDINGWNIYQELKFVSDTSDTGKLLKYIIGSPAAPYGDPEEIMETFSWDGEQLNKTLRLLTDAGLIDAQYADDKIDTIFVTEMGIEKVRIGNAPPSSFFVGGNISGSNVISGNNNTIVNFTKPSDEGK